MYGKIFAKMYEGTLYGQWEALVTFQQLIVLADADGMVDMTTQAISSRTGIPLKIIEKGIRILEAPDPHSRTPDQEGRRIERIDDHRPWGWHLVNHAKYMAMQDADTVRQQTRERVRRHREKRQKDQSAGAVVTPVTVGNGQKRHTDIDTDTDKESKPLAPSAPRVDAGGPVNGSAVAYIPLNDGTDYGISTEQFAEFEKLYPAVDVKQTLNEIRGWNLANPTHRKTRSGVLRHVNRWLAKEQNRGA